MHSIKSAKREPNNLHPLVPEENAIAAEVYVVSQCRGQNDVKRKGYLQSVMLDFDSPLGQAFERWIVYFRQWCLATSLKSGIYESSYVGLRLGCS